MNQARRAWEQARVERGTGSVQFIHSESVPVLQNNSICVVTNDRKWRCEPHSVVNEA